MNGPDGYGPGDYGPGDYGPVFSIAMSIFIGLSPILLALLFIYKLLIDIN